MDEFYLVKVSHIGQWPLPHLEGMDKILSKIWILRGPSVPFFKALNKIQKGKILVDGTMITCHGHS